MSDRDLVRERFLLLKRLFQTGWSNDTLESIFQTLNLTKEQDLRAKLLQEILDECTTETKAITKLKQIECQ